MLKREKKIIKSQQLESAKGEPFQIYTVSGGRK